MKIYPAPTKTIAAIMALLLFVSLNVTGLAQTTTSSVDTVKDSDKDDVTELKKMTVTTGYRSPKAIDQIPGAVKLVSAEEISHTSLLTDDATAVLSRTVPGYSPGTQQLQNTGETLRGRVALRLFDGISQTTPLREGSRNATFTDMDIISQIEVINGPSASEGIGAAGGIINYISKSPTKEGSEATLRTKFSTEGWDDSDSGSYRVGLNYAVKKGPNDLIFGTAFVKRGMSFDANGRRIGMGASGSTTDSETKNLFIKAGHNFGVNNAQRISLTASQFRLEGMGHYIQDPGNRALGITDSAKRGVPPGSKAAFNDFSQYALAYNHNALFGGSLNVQAYKASQEMRFVPELGGVDKWDPKFGPLATFVDQSEINSQKRGVRSNWSRENLFEIDGFEMNVGFDYLYETAQQRLALTDRLWVPPMNYTSKAPFVQSSYTRGPVTVSAGIRHEDGSLQVDDYTTVFFAKNTFVRGGTLPYKENMPNVGLIVRLPRGWSAFGSYSKGFTLPNVGIPLRNVSTPGLSVEGVIDLEAVIVDNKEGGVAWQGKRGSFGISYYHSYSELGSSLTSALLGTPPNQTLELVLQRRPVDVKGLEFTGEFRLNKAWKFIALYSHTKGYTRTTATGPLTRQMGMGNVSPSKINLSASWKFSDKGSVTVDMDNLLKRDINVGAPGEEHTSGLTLFNLTASYSTKWGDFSLGVENLTDKYYILPWAQIDQFQNYFAGRGRVISVSHAIKF